MDILVRQATLDDLDTIQNLNHELFILEKERFDPTLITDWPLSYAGEQYFTGLIETGYVIVATDADTIIGYLAGSIDDKGAYSCVQYGEINNMFVMDKYRGCGVGRALVDKFKKYCVDKGIHNIKVVASAKNANARQFYQRQGFNEFDITLTMEID